MQNTLLEEKQVISILLTVPEAVKTVQNEGIRAEDFSNDSYREIFIRIVEHGELTEQMILSSDPEKQDFLVEIMANQGMQSYLPNYCKRLKELTARRKTVTECRRLISLAEDRKTDFHPSLTAVITKLQEQQNRLTARRAKTVEEIEAEYADFIDPEKSKDRIIRYGLPFDQLIRHNRGEVFTLGAPPGGGKTAFALTAMLNMLKNGRKAAILCQEMPTPVLIARMTANLSETPLHRIFDGEKTEVIRTAEQIVFEAMKKNRLLIKGSGEYQHSVAGIRGELERFYSLAGSVDLFTVDYIQVVKCEKAKDRREQIDLAAEAMKQLAIEINAGCLLLSQLSRSGQQEKEVGLAALKESSHLEEISAIVAFLRRTDNDGEIEFLCRKNRNGKGAFNGRLVFEPEFARFSAHRYGETYRTPSR